MMYENLMCFKCNCTETLLWNCTADKQPLCNDCYEQIKANTKQEPESNRKADERRNKLRKSTRSTRKNGTSLGSSSSTTCKTTTMKLIGRGRRNLFRKPPVKAPTIPATTQHVKSLFYKGSYIQIGDIVSLCNSNDDIFYAQIRGLMIDSFCEKSAFITWLLPTQSSPPAYELFDPSTYIIGPEEDQPRLLECMEFIMHAPSDYYYDKNTPYPLVDSFPHKLQKNSGNGFIWTSTDLIQN